MKTHEFSDRSLFEQCPDGIPSGEWSRFRDHYNRAARLEVFDHPIQLDIELNGGCNMRCPFCWHGYENIANDLMGFDDYVRLIDEAVSIGVKSVKLNYINEPMLRKDLEDAIAYAKAAGILNVYLTTNGSLLGEKRQRSMLASGVTKVFISLDTVTSETYRLMRLNGLFDRVVKNVLDFIKLRDDSGLRYPLIRVNFLRTQINKHEEQAFREFWKGRADFIAFQNMNDLPDQDTGLRVAGSGMADGFGCSFPFKQLVVDHDGDILPCCKMGGKKLRLGNVADMSLLDAWRSESMARLQSLHSEGRYQDHDVCRRCIDGEDL